MEVESMVVAVVAVFAVLAAVLAFADLQGGEWETVAKNVAPLIIALVTFTCVIGGIAYWKK